MRAMNPQKIWQNGIRLLEQGDDQAATEQFDKACALDPVAQAPYLESATPLQWSERGLSFLRLNFPDQAMVCFAKAAQVEDADLHTQSVSSVLVVCQALEEMGSLEAAATLLERALTLSQGQSTVRRRLERVLMKLLQQESGRHALSVGERLKSLLPKDDARRGIVYCYQGHAYRRGGQPELALEAYKTAMKRGAPGAERSRRELILELNRPELYDEMNGSELVHLILWDMFQLPLSRAERVPQELSEEELDRLLRGEIDVVKRTQEGFLLRIWTELGGGVCLTALGLWTPGSFRFESFLRDRYRQPRWSQGLSPHQLAESELRATVNWDRVDWTQLALRRDLEHPVKMDSPERCWKRVRTTIMAQSPHVRLDQLGGPRPSSMKTEEQASLAAALHSDEERLDDLIWCWLHWESPEFVLETVAYLGHDRYWMSLRRCLACLDEANYERLRKAAAEMLSGEDARVDFGIPYCFPEMTDWTARAAQLWLEDVNDLWSGWKLLPHWSTLEQLERVLRVKNLHYMETHAVVELPLVLKEKAIPILIRLFDACPFADQREVCLEALTLLQSPVVERFFLEGSGDEEVAALGEVYLGRRRARAKTDDSPMTPIRFPDRCLETSVAEALRKNGRGKAGSLELEEEVLTFYPDDLRLIDELEISELTLKRADSLDEDATPIVRSLEGLQYCSNLKRLKIHQSAPLSLRPLSGLRRLESLEIGSPDDNWPADWKTAWSLVNLETLVDLPLLQRLKLPVDGSLNLDYPSLLDQIQVNFELVSSRSIDFAKTDAQGRRSAVERLWEAVAATYGELWKEQGLSSVEFDRVTDLIVASTLVLADPAPYDDWAVLFPGREQDLAQVERWLEGSAVADPVNRRVLADWISRGFGKPFQEQVVNCLSQSVGYLVRRLQGERTEAVNWFRRRRNFQRKLDDYRPLDSEPRWDKDKGRLIWGYREQDRASAECHVLGSQVGDEFRAGWYQSLATVSLNEVLGVPSILRCSRQRGFELAGRIAAQLEDAQMILEYPSGPDTVLYLAVGSLSGC